MRALPPTFRIPQNRLYLFCTNNICLSQCHNVHRDFDQRQTALPLTSTTSTARRIANPWNTSASRSLKRFRIVSRRVLASPGRGSSVALRTVHSSLVFSSHSVLLPNPSLSHYLHCTLRVIFFSFQLFTKLTALHRFANPSISYFCSHSAGVWCPARSAESFSRKAKGGKVNFVSKQRSKLTHASRKGKVHLGVARMRSVSPFTSRPNVLNVVVVVVADRVERTLDSDIHVLESFS